MVKACASFQLTVVCALDFTRPVQAFACLVLSDTPRASLLPRGTLTLDTLVLFPAADSAAIMTCTEHSLQNRHRCKAPSYTLVQDLPSTASFMLHHLTSLVI